MDNVWGPLITGLVSLLGAIAFSAKVLAAGYVKQMTLIVDAYLKAADKQSEILGQVAHSLQTMHEDHTKQANDHQAQMETLAKLCANPDCPISKIKVRGKPSVN